MQIERLSIRNYRVFKNVDIQDIPPLTFFVGANGTGKSTLFDVADLAAVERAYEVESEGRVRWGRSSSSTMNIDSSIWLTRSRLTD